MFGMRKAKQQSSDNEEAKVRLRNIRWFKTGIESGGELAYIAEDNLKKIEEYTHTPPEYPSQCTMYLSILYGLIMLNRSVGHLTDSEQGEVEAFDAIYRGMPIGIANVVARKTSDSLANKVDTLCKEETLALASQFGNLPSSAEGGREGTLLWEFSKFFADIWTSEKETVNDELAGKLYMALVDCAVKVPYEEILEKSKKSSVS